MRLAKRGQSLVEFALTVPLLLLLLFGIIDFSYYLYGWSTVQFAAVRGVQQAAQMPPLSLQRSYTDAEIAADSCLKLIYDRAKGGTWGFTPNNDEFSFRWTKISGLTETDMVGPGGSVSRNEIVVPNTIVQLDLVHTASPLTPLAQTIFGDEDFTFHAQVRRTVLNIDVAPNNICQ